MIEDLKSLLHAVMDVKGLIQSGGYLALHVIVFAETGLLVGFFLPGDSLLFTAGVFSAAGLMNVWVLLIGLSIAAVAGDQVGYVIGRKAGQALYNRPDSRFFKRKHLIAAHDFYEKYGGKTIFLARFVPIIRTFAPTVAGAAGMEYRKFVFFNIAGGIAWVWSMVGGGYLIGSRIPKIEERIHIVALVIIVLSVLPIVWETYKARKAKPAEPASAPVVPEVENS
ncbi:MAG: Protein DedA [Thermoanaerobaculia bacterium]|nr:Protein DedA [Thermoanaerobaculia bacterium]